MKNPFVWLYFRHPFIYGLVLGAPGVVIMEEYIRWKMKKLGLREPD